MRVTTTATLLVTLMTSSVAVADKPNFARVFASRDACFELYDLNAKKLVVRSDARHCAERMSPVLRLRCRSRLWPSTLAFSSMSTRRSNGTGRTAGATVEPRPDGRVVDARFRRLVLSAATPQLGMQRVGQYLGRFGFGNGDMSGGITTAWLDSSLRISADEQLRFWERFWLGDLPVSKHAIDTTKKITFVERSAAGWILHGKTGSGSGATAGTRGHELQHGWFVGHVARGAQEYVFATAYSDRSAPKDGRPAGWVARDLTKQILGALDLY